MAEDFTLESERSKEIQPIPPSSPRLGGVPPEIPPPHPESEAQLGAQASLQAAEWKLSPARKRCPAMKVQWRNAKESIEQAIQEIRKVSAPAQLSDSENWLIENTRLLRSAFRETRRLSGYSRDLPQMEIEEGDERRRVPRAYAASVAFLEAVAFAFDEHAFDVYFSAAQDRTAFEIGELWALRPLLELVLLEKIAAISGHLRTEATHSPSTPKAHRQEIDIPLSRVIL
ncbi:MAG: hypothetical protein ACREP9_08880, partial [Candidatus Dormibacteraceae bacterium]